MENQPEPRSHAPALSKSDINLLPLKRYEGPVEVIADDERLRAAMPLLHAEDVLGFDIEVRPTFKSGDHFPPALVQLAGRHRVFLVQLKRVSALHELGALFADARVIKTGVAVSGDLEKLHEVMRFEPAGFIDLGKLAARKGIKAGGVRTLAAQLLGLRISKGAQCSNWERAELAPAQVVYAATDAWICREIYLCLDRMADAGKKNDHHVLPKATGSTTGAGGQPWSK
jgi:ribonuclease D